MNLSLWRHETESLGKFLPAILKVLDFQPMIWDPNQFPKTWEALWFWIENSLRRRRLESMEPASDGFRNPSGRLEISSLKLTVRNKKWWFPIVFLLFQGTIFRCKPLVSGRVIEKKTPLDWIKHRDGLGNPCVFLMFCNHFGKSLCKERRRLLW